MWIADNHTFDFFTEGENGKPHRVYLTAFTDAKSEGMVGWNLTENPCSDSTLLALRHGILRFGVPRAIYVDNGSEFLVSDIGGRGHRRKKDWNKDPLLAAEVEQALIRAATGYTVTEKKIKFVNGAKTVETVERHIPPSNAAIEFYLINKKPGEYSRTGGVSGDGEGKIEEILEALKNG